MIDSFIQWSTKRKQFEETWLLPLIAVIALTVLILY